MFSVVMIMLISALIVGWTIYYSIWSKVADPTSFEYANLDTIWSNVNILLFVRVPILVVFVSLFSLILSHKIAGPVYRFEQSSKRIANGDLSLRIKLRQGDELKELADIFNKMTENLEMFVVKDREVIDRVIDVINQVPMTLRQDEIDEKDKKKVGGESRETDTV
jgi:methyl-accepting chemotaxis protein